MTGPIVWWRGVFISEWALASVRELDEDQRAQLAERLRKRVEEKRGEA